LPCACRLEADVRLLAVGMASLSKTENITLENISDLVRSKQQELNNFHDLQIQQLEKVIDISSSILSFYFVLFIFSFLSLVTQGIDDRNKLLSEASRKFNLLKDDFQYNLTLLEARDVEIQRLSQVEVNLLNEIEFKENEIKILAQKYDKLQTKERENYHKYQEERSKTKVYPSTSSSLTSSLLEISLGTPRRSRVIALVNK
jgi:preprotein translocase subunit SecF